MSNQSCGTCGIEICPDCYTICEQCKAYICDDCEAQDFLCEECLFKNNSCDICKDKTKLYSCELCHNKICETCNKPCSKCKAYICNDCEAQDFLCEECLFKYNRCDICDKYTKQYSCDLCHNKICQTCNKPCSKCKRDICKDCYQYSYETICEYCIQDENMKAELTKKLSVYELTDLNNLIKELKEENEKLKKENEKLTNKLLEIKKIVN